MANWTKFEVDLIIADYFEMLSKELANIPYQKSSHRRNLIPLLNQRSNGSIEFKHQNISAALINLGLPYIKGYLPRFHSQRLLEEQVVNYLSSHLSIEKEFIAFTEKEIFNQNNTLNFESLVVKPPSVGFLQEPNLQYAGSPIKINYLEREQSNSKLGLLGEKLVFDYEKWSLIRIGKEKLAESVRWISQDEGDGAGFDILSKKKDGSDKYVEVKTTRLGKETPFFFSRNELLFSIKHKNNFNLVRMFNFEKNAKMFIKEGGLDSICKSIPMTFKGYF
jgi:uncharacterized protein DUF3883